MTNINLSLFRLMYAHVFFLSVSYRRSCRSTLSSLFIRVSKLIALSSGLLRITLRVVLLSYVRPAITCSLILIQFNSDCFFNFLWFFRVECVYRKSLQISDMIVIHVVIIDFFNFGPHLLPPNNPIYKLR